MKRFIFNPKTGLCEWKEYIPLTKLEFGKSVVQKQKYLKDRVRINNQEVSTGKNRTALYTMPGGVDNGVRYSALYEHSGLDITELKAAESALKSARSEVEKKIKDEVQKNLKELEDKAIKDTVPKANTTDQE